MRNYHCGLFAVLVLLAACSEESKVNDPYATKDKEGNSVAPEKSYCGGGGTSGSPALDVVIRDFSVTHPDFENFSEEYADGHGADIQAYGKPGYDADWSARDALHKTCGNQASGQGITIGTNGLPTVANPYLPAYLQQTGTEVLEYGECASPQYVRGYKNAAEYIYGEKCDGGNVAWSNKVYYTPGMVQSYLTFDPRTVGGDYDMHNGVHIQKAGDLCDNSYFDQWYADVPGTNWRINRTLDLPQVAGTNYYQLNFNYNNGGYSPLDSTDGPGYSGNYMGAVACAPEMQESNKNCQQFGPQSLSIFCPPYAYQYAGVQVDQNGQKTDALCASWLANGGPKVEGAARAAADPNGTLGFQHLRNNGFTMMGYVKFKYKPENQAPNHEVLEFTGDDDMWIFVDGVLAVDLGGTHLAAPGRVDIEVLAQNNHGCHEGEPLAGYSNCIAGAATWQANTWHHLHFFYANRQTRGPSTFMIRSNISDLAAPKYSGNFIADVSVQMGEGTQTAITLSMNAGLDQEAIGQMQAQASANANAQVGDAVDPAAARYPILVRRLVDGREMVYGMLLTGVSVPQGDGSGNVYKLRGVLADENGNIVDNIREEDQFALNYNGVEGSDNMIYGYWNTHAIDLVTVSGEKVDGFPGEWYHDCSVE